MRSSVFEAMFFGPMATQLPEVVLKEENEDAFRILIDCIYGLEPPFAFENVCEVLHLADKYWVSDVTDRCVTYLENSLDIDNVWTVLELAITYRLEHLKPRCIAFIVDQNEAVFKMESFLNISASVIEMLLSNESIGNMTCVMSKACYQWAAAALEKKNTVCDNASIQQLLGNIAAKITDKTSADKVNECLSLVPHYDTLRDTTTIRFAEMTNNTSAIFDPGSVGLELIPNSQVSLMLVKFNQPVSIQSVLVYQRTSQTNPMHFLENWELFGRCILFRNPIVCSSNTATRITFRMKSNNIFETGKVCKTTRLDECSVTFKSIPTIMASISMHTLTRRVS